jgi:hypothetical protein
MSTCGDGALVLCGRSPRTGTPALLRASDSERGAALVAGGLVSLGCAALVFSDVPRVQLVIGDDLADGGACE